MSSWLAKSEQQSEASLSDRKPRGNRPPQRESTICGSFQQRGKSRLLEMFVAAQSVRHFPLAHDDKRGAIGQRPFLIRMLMKLKGIRKDHPPGRECP